MSDDAFEKWTEARFEAQLRDLDIMGPAFSRAFAFIADDASEAEESRRPTASDWLYGGERSRRQQPAGSLLENHLRLDGPRAAEARLELLCAQHEARLEGLLQKYVVAVTPPDPPTEQPAQTEPVHPSSDDEDAPDFRSFLGPKFQHRDLSEAARSLALQRQTNIEASRKRPRPS